jgi:hypothetical protein
LLWCSIHVFILDKRHPITQLFFVFIHEKNIRKSINAFDIYKEMFNKQAVWIQTAVCCHITFFLACILSFQTFSFKQDSIWTLLFALTSFLHFTVAEHRDFVNLKLSTIMDVAYYLESFLQVLMVFGCFVSVNWTNLLFLFLFSVCIRKMPQRYSQWVVLVVLLNGMNLYTFLVLFCVAMQYKRRQYLNKSVSQCHATIYLKKSVACQALYVLLQAFILWVIRCESRFPHKLRYTPILIAMIATVSAIVYCHYYVLETLVSVTSTISSVNTYHPLTVSMNAIMQCEQCRKHLSNIDLEDSILDNVYKFDKDYNI